MLHIIMREVDNALIVWSNGWMLGIDRLHMRAIYQVIVQPSRLFCEQFEHLLLPSKKTVTSPSHLIFLLLQLRQALLATIRLAFDLSEEVVSILEPYLWGYNINLLFLFQNGVDL